MDMQVDTAPLLRPAQLADAQGERNSLQKKLESPHIQDKGEVVRQLRRLDKSLSEQTPRPFVGQDQDSAVRMEARLLAEILDGMPSHEEMRKGPPGALEKHQAWEARNEQKILQWKNLRLRLNAGNPDGSVANLEKYRPRSSTLNMDNAQITGAQYYLPPPGVAPVVTFDDTELAFLRDVSPGLADKLALLGNEERAQVKAALQMPATGQG